MKKQGIEGVSRKYLIDEKMETLSSVFLSSSEIQRKRNMGLVASGQPMLEVSDGLMFEKKIKEVVREG